VRIEDQDALVCIPDFSLCTCGARDGEYQALTITVKPGNSMERFSTRYTGEFQHPKVVLE